jgi:Holliday junction resolvase RusA-like endonuclease
MNSICFFVPGEPRPKQSFRVGRGGGFQSARVKGWQADCGYAAQIAMREMGLYEPLPSNMHLTVEMVFFLGNSRKVDLDNLSKCVGDGLNNVLWVDDQHNIRLILDKYICRTKQGVFVRLIENTRPLEITEPDMDMFFVEYEAVKQILQKEMA